MNGAVIMVLALFERTWFNKHAVVEVDILLILFTSIIVLVVYVYTYQKYSIILVN